MTALRDLAAKLRNIDPHGHAIVKRRRRGDDDDAVVGYDVYFSAARLINNALADGAFDSPAFQSLRPGPSALASLAEWLQRNGSPVFDGDIVRADRLADALASLAGPPPPPATHSSDFTFVNWFGTEYTFATGAQAQSVRALWQEWERTGHGLHQATIAAQVDENEDTRTFRLDKVFRHHCAYRQMIQPAGDGRYRLVPPEKKSKKNPTSPAKAPLVPEPPAQDRSRK